MSESNNSSSSSSSSQNSSEGGTNSEISPDDEEAKISDRHLEIEIPKNIIENLFNSEDSLRSFLN